MSTIRVEEAVDIRRPVDEVFGYVSDPSNHPQWSGTVVDVQTDAAGAGGVGSRFTAHQKFLGRKFEVPYEVTTAERGRRYAYRAVGGPIEPTLTFDVEGLSPDSTRLTMRVEGDAGTFFGLVGPVLEKAIGRQVRNDLETAKDMLEHEQQ